MKDTHFLYSVATLAVGSILAIFVGLATGMLPKSPLREVRVSSAVLATTPAKKDCDCCSKMTPQESAAFRQRNETLKKQRAAYQKATELLKQYGLKEGMRRIKEFAPEIAEHFEHFTEKYTVAEEHSSHRCSCFSSSFGRMDPRSRRR